MPNEGADSQDDFGAGAPAPAADASATVVAVGAAGQASAADVAPFEARPAASESVEAVAPSGNTLAAVRLLLQPKKRGEGVAALVTDVAQQLGRTPELLIKALAAAGVKEPVDAETKPTFGENAGEIFWLNRNAKGQLWLNAKASKASAKKSRSKKTDDGASGD